MDNAWVTRLLQVFGPLLAAWSAFLAFLVHLKKLRNSEKAAAHGRLLGEIDRLSSQLAVKTEECDMVRDRWAECERISNERLGRAVIAEAKLLVQDQADGRPSILPGTTERHPTEGNGK